MTNELRSFVNDGCIGCGTCEAQCQLAAIEICGSKAVVDPKICVGCGMCVAVCPTDSLELVPLNEWYEKNGM